MTLAHDEMREINCNKKDIFEDLKTQFELEEKIISIKKNYLFLVQYIEDSKEKTQEFLFELKKLNQQLKSIKQKNDFTLNHVNDFKNLFPHYELF